MTGVQTCALPILDSNKFDFSTKKGDYSILKKEKKDGNYVVTIETKNKKLINYMKKSPGKINFHSREKIINSIKVK